MNESSQAEITLCLTGDVMTGRGIDQILPHPSDPQLQEGYVKDARDYVSLAEGATGPIPAPVGWEYVWGEALPLLKESDALVINLETSVTRSDRYWPDKDIHYRMHPDNVECLLAAGVDCCVLANNHVLDWGVAGLQETLSCLRNVGLETVGAGQDLEAARAPAVMSLPEDRRALVYAYGAISSGIPPRWAAERGRPGISLLEDLSRGMVDRITDAIEANHRPGDIVIVSLHWGPNWGYAVPDDRIHFAHALIDSGRVDVVHGHSSHHPIGVERYREGLILYGCGDFLNDYEGIGGYESFRSDLVLLYRITFRGDLPEPALRMTPLQIRRMRLNRAKREDVEWLATALTRASARFGTRFDIDEHDEFVA